MAPFTELVNRPFKESVFSYDFSLCFVTNEKTRKVQKLQLIQPNAMPVTSTGATLNGQPVTLLQV